MAPVPGQQPRQKANQRIANSWRCSVDGRVDNQINWRTASDSRADNKNITADNQWTTEQATGRKDNWGIVKQSVDGVVIVGKQSVALKGRELVECSAKTSGQEDRRVAGQGSAQGTIFGGQQGRSGRDNKGCNDGVTGRIMRKQHGG